MDGSTASSCSEGGGSCLIGYALAGCISTGTIKGAGIIVIVPLLTTWTLSAETPPAAFYKKNTPEERGLRLVNLCFLSLSKYN
jgi:hypothetical protein